MLISTAAAGQEPAVDFLGAAELHALPDTTGDVQTDRLIAIARAAYGVFGGELDVRAASALVRADLRSMARLDTAETPVLAIVTWPALAADEIALVEELLARILDKQHSRSSPLATSRAILWRGLTHLIRGALADAIDDSETALRLVEEHGWRLGVPAALAWLVDALVDSGRRDAARRVLATREDWVQTPTPLTTRTVFAT